MKIVLQSLQAEFPEGEVAPGLELGRDRRRVADHHLLVLVVDRLDHQLQRLIIVELAAVGEFDQEFHVIPADNETVAFLLLLAVAHLDGVGHVPGRRNVGERVEDPRHRGANARNKNHRQRQHANDRHGTRTTEILSVEDPAWIETADPFQGLGDQLAMKRRGNRHRSRLVFQVDARHQPVVNLGQLRLDPAGHQHVRKTTEQRP